MDDRLEPRSPPAVRIFRRTAPVSVLGPGERAVIWVQGCRLACRGCIVPESWDARGGASVPVSDLAGWVLAQPGIEGITLSGGEPMDQAAGLAALIDVVRRGADLGVVLFTGYTHERLESGGSGEQKALLERTDLLIDGPYIEPLHADLLWRGSSNQRLLPLTTRYRRLVTSLPPESDRSAGLQFEVDERGVMGYAGVPAVPRFDPEFRRRMREHGVALQTREEVPP